MKENIQQKWITFNFNVFSPHVQKCRKINLQFLCIAMDAKCPPCCSIKVKAKPQYFSDYGASWRDGSFSLKDIQDKILSHICWIFLHQLTSHHFTNPHRGFSSPLHVWLSTEIAEKVWELKSNILQFISHLTAFDDINML